MAYSDQDLVELRQEFTDDTAEWREIRDEGAIDMRHVSGDPWDPADRLKREQAGRPVISEDEIGQYINQVVNEIRANKRAVKFTPVGSGANDESAKFYEDKMREIEYRSRAQIAYTTAFENAVQRSYGFCRVTTRYESSKSLNQDIWIDPIHNPDLVTPDPYALMPDLSDMTHCWVREPWALDDFNRRFKDAKIDEGRSLNLLMQDAPTWITKNAVWVAERWKIKTTKRTLLMIQPDAPTQQGSVLGLSQGTAPEPVAEFEDERQTPGQVVGQRDVEDKSVYQCLTNGIEILEETPWLGKYIPIIGCLGKVIYLDEGAGSKRKILSLTRLARDPYMLYCYIRACQTELVGMTPKFPYFVRRGSLNPTQLELLVKSVYEPVAVIEVEPSVPGMPGGAPPEMPQRNPWDPAIEHLEILAEAQRRAIQSAMGLTPLPTAAQRRNEKSGKALQRIEEAGQRGSYHFTDHYLDMIMHVGIIVEDLMDKIYDSARDVGIRKANDTAEIVRINDESADKPVSTKGDHLVTVSTGPSFDSEREAASDFADTLANISPEVFGVLGPLIVKLKNLGPTGDEMIELLEAVQPPPIQQLRQSKQQQQPNDPRAAQQQLMQAKQQLQQLQSVAEQMKQQLDQDMAKQRATMEKAKIDADTNIKLQMMRDATSIAVAKINALAKGVIADNEAQMEAIALDHEQSQFALTQAHEAHEAQLDREHQAQVAEQAHRQALEQGQQGHEQALEQGDQGIAGQLAVQDNAPAPTNGASA
jgi:hypothetical protein